MPCTMIGETDETTIMKLGYLEDIDNNDIICYLYSFKSFISNRLYCYTVK